MWNPDQYLKFGDERTQPCRDLVNRIQLDDVRCAIDLGCGPGNSTKVLRERWPNADITGLDASSEMIDAARESEPNRRWVVRDIADWAVNGDDPVDLLFSNAALHWVPAHELIFPQLLSKAKAALAVQMPSSVNSPAHQLMDDLASSPDWRDLLRNVSKPRSHELSFYYDLLAGHASHLDLWSTEYIHVLPKPDAIVEWYKSTGLRPYLEGLGDESDRTKFIAEYTEGIRTIYHSQLDGSVLFPFRRVFVIAYR